MSISPLVQGSHPSLVPTPTIKNRNPSIEDFNFRSGLPTKAVAEKSARIVAEQRANILMERLREMGIDPETILKEKGDLS
jgi:hypothetical protein